MSESDAPKTVVLTDKADRIDYAKLTTVAAEAGKLGHSVMAHGLCMECSSETEVPPPVNGQVRVVEFRHEDWCPVLAQAQGRELTDAEKKRHRRYMDLGGV